MCLYARHIDPAGGLPHDHDVCEMLSGPGDYTIDQHVKPKVASLFRPLDGNHY